MNNALKALLEEYKRTLVDLKNTIKDIDSKDLIKIRDTKTRDNDCKSIQNVLAHVVRSGYGYAIYIQNYRGTPTPQRERIYHTEVNAYLQDLDDMYQYNLEALKDVKKSELEKYDCKDKIKVNWGQYYDIEQLLEHAIVHILRHRRQIENWIKS